MFALGLYDFRDESLWLVRDRFGVKPLFYAEVGKQFLFASQIATILAHPQIQSSPNWRATMEATSSVSDAPWSSPR